MAWTKHAAHCLLLQEVAPTRTRKRLTGHTDLGFAVGTAEWVGLGGVGIRWAVMTALGMEFGTECSQNWRCGGGLRLCPWDRAWHLEGNERAVRAVLCAVCARCARFGARCFINPPFFHLVTAGCKHHSPTSISTACGRAAGSKICDHPPPSARAGTPGDRRP